LVVLRSVPVLLKEHEACKCVRDRMDEIRALPNWICEIVVFHPK